MAALYHELPSEDFISMVVKAVFGRGCPTGKKSEPSACVTGVGMFRSELLSRWTPREPA
jgi:hypothetical protein